MSHDPEEPGTWICSACHATNSQLDATCQFCDADEEVETFDEPDYAHPIDADRERFYSDEGRLDDINLAEAEED